MFPLKNLARKALMKTDAHFRGTYIYMTKFIMRRIDILLGITRWDLSEINHHFLDPYIVAWQQVKIYVPESKVHGTIWGRQDPGWPQVGPWTLLSGTLQANTTVDDALARCVIKPSAVISTEQDKSSLVELSMQ